MAGLKLVILLLLGGIVLPAFSKVEFPDSPVGKRASEITELINQESKYSIANYINTCFSGALLNKMPITLHMSIFQSTQSFYGKIELVSIINSTDYEISFMVRSISQDAMLEVNLSVEAKEPYLIKMVLFKPVFLSDEKEMVKSNVEQTGVDTLKNNRIKQSQLQMIRRAMDSINAENMFSGVILLANNGNPVFFKSYGYASKRFIVVNELGTKFNLGSLSRLFIKIAILKLYDEKQLSIDDPIGKFLNGFPDKIAGKTTIRHLLSSQTGWEDFYIARKVEIGALQKVLGYIDQIRDMQILFPPGSEYLESNTGLLVAAAIIEEVTATEYYTYIRENVFKPTGMANTGFFMRDKPTRNIATGYTNKHPLDTVKEDFAWENTVYMPVNVVPADGVYSTADDMLSLSDALFENKLMTERSRDLLFSEFNFPNNLKEDDQCVCMYGKASGISTLFILDLETKITIISLSNYDPPVAKTAAEIILKVLN